MLKSIILFVVFFILGCIMFFCFLNFSATYKLENFLPLIFLEIAIYGSFILYEISKKNK